MYTPVLGALYSTNIGYPGTRGPNTRGSVNGPGSIPGPTIPGTRHRVPASQSDGVQLLSDCRRRISGVSYMCWMDFYNGILCCGFSCARLISFSFVSLLCVSFPATTPRAIYTPRAVTPLQPLHGYHACVYLPVSYTHLTLPTILLV